jgi:hypothetical protein
MGHIPSCCFAAPTASSAQPCSGVGTVAFIWGGCVWGAYAVALVAMGRRFTGGTLAVVNAAFVMAYTFANIVAPPVAGSAMDAMDPHGLMLVAIIVASSFTLIVTLRRREFDSN